jgi:hypothetical protein
MITTVIPQAMIPRTDTCRAMLKRLAMVRKLSETRLMRTARSMSISKID